MRVPDQFRRYAVGNDGVFTRAGALANGLSPRQFRTGSSNGEWLRYRGVWMLTTIQPSQRSVARAALLHAGPDARLTGTSALLLRGLDVAGGLVTLSVPEGTNRKISGAVLLRDRDRVEVVQFVDGFPVMPRARSIVDALRLARTNQARSILDEVLRRGWITADELARWCDRLRDHKGLPALRARLADAKSGTFAESERLLRRLVRRAGLSGWVFNADIHSPGGELLGIGDCVNFELKIVVEVDGWAWHTDAKRFQRDRDRQNSLVQAGWTVLRFTWLDLSERSDHVIASIRHSIARAHQGDLGTSADRGRSATTIRRRT